MSNDLAVMDTWTRDDNEKTLMADLKNWLEWVTEIEGRQNDTASINTEGTNYDAQQ